MTKTKDLSLLAVGSIAFDSIRTPAGKVEEALGGSVNYFSIASSFFTHTKVVGIVGNDFPDSHLRWLNSRNVDTSGIEKTQGSTFRWVGEYNDNLNEAKTLSTQLNVFETFQPKLSEGHRSCDYLFLGNIDPVLQLNVLEQMKTPRLIACDSMNFWITGKPEELKKTLQQIDILSINDGEASLLSGQKNLLAAAETILDMGPSVVIIKRGEYGASLFTQGKTFLTPAFPVRNVVDPTGAGDSFAGGFFGYLASTGVDRETVKNDPKKWYKVLREAVVTGSVMASFTVEDFSFHKLKEVSKDELDTRKNKFQEMIGM